MAETLPKVTYDRRGTPGIWAEDDLQAYTGLGLVHGMHRPLQTLLLANAARGQLAQRIWPLGPLCHIDHLVHRLDLPRRAAVAAEHLAARDAARLDAFVAGMQRGLTRRRPLQLVAALGLLRLPYPDRQSVLAGLLLASYVGLAESQDRMERSLVACLQNGADVPFLESLHAPNLVGWDPALLRRVRAPLPQVAPATTGQAGGSNAWAVGGARSASGYPLLCGDPHLQVNQLPAQLFEVRAWVGTNYWLGATIPGLPGLAVGRNRTLAFSGTFSCGDNIDSAVETQIGDAVRRPNGNMPLQRREVVYRRRLRKDRVLRFAEGPRGVLDAPDLPGPQLATAWCSGADLAAAMGAYMQLPFAADVPAARRVLAAAHTLSLHYVLADRSGNIGHQQAGRVPRRTAGWSGLYPVDAQGPAAWQGLYTGAGLGGRDAVDDMVVSANEAGQGDDGGLLATLAQPDYRRCRIAQCIAARRDHTLASMQAIQCDLLSLQGQRLRPWLQAAMPPGPLRQALAQWDLQCQSNSLGADAFDRAYRAALGAFAVVLGPQVWPQLLATTEVRIWWCAALDRALATPATWAAGSPLGTALRMALKQVATAAPEPWGRTQQFRLPHMLLGSLVGPRGALPLPGSIATVSQGNLVPAGEAVVAVAPAYRMVCDLGDDSIETSMPGGIDDHPAHPTYTQWLPDWRAGQYHRLVPPTAEERS
jgi:penicillin amidase